MRNEYCDDDSGSDDEASYEDQVHANGSDDEAMITGKLKLSFFCLFNYRKLGFFGTLSLKMIYNESFYNFNFKIKEYLYMQRSKKIQDCLDKLTKKANLQR